MRKIVLGIAVVAVLAVVGGFGFQAWLKNKVQSEVENSFAGLRASGVNATFTGTNVALLDRKVTISGVRIAATNGDSVLDLDNLDLRISGAPTNERMQADEMAFSGLRLTLKGEPASGGEVVYTIPTLNVRGYEGPMKLLPSDQHGGPYAALRLVLRQFATLRADELRVPSANVVMTAAPSVENGQVRTQMDYQDIALDKIDAGKVQKLSIADVRFKADYLTEPKKAEPAPVPAPDVTPAPDANDDGADDADTTAADADTATDTDADTEANAFEHVATVPNSGEIKNILIHEIDTNPVLAATEPTGQPQTDATSPAPKADEPYQRIFRLLETGAHSVTIPDSTNTAASTRIEELGIRPSAFSPERIAALNALNIVSSNLSLDEAQQALALTTGLIEAVNLGNVTIKDMESKEKQATTRTGSLVLDNLSNGILGKLEMNNAEVRDEDGLTRFGRFTLNRLDIPVLTRFSETVNASLSDASLLLFRIIAGFEIENVEVPDTVSGTDKSEPIRVGKFSLAWGNLLGDAPTRLELNATDLSGAITDEDELPFSLLASAGMTRANVGLVLNVIYDQATQTLSIAPAESTLQNAFKVRLEAKADNVAKEIFTEESAVEEALQNVTAGPISLSVTNLGFAELMMKSQAEKAGVSVDEYRQQLLALFTGLAGSYAEGPEAQQVTQAVVDFINNPKTLTISATPKGRVPLQELLDSDDPDAITRAFTISATTAP